VLLVARLRKQFPQLRIIIDFRDEWLSSTIDLVSFSRTDRARLMAQASEAEAVANADAVVAVTEAARRQIRARYPNEPEAKFQIVSNGYDASTLAPAAASLERRNKVVVTYVGTIYGSTNPLPLVEALRSLPDEARSRLQLIFIGHIEEQRFREALLELGSMVELRGFAPQKEALSLLSQSDYALLISHDALNVSAKLYDYVGAQKPILAVINPAGACRDLIEKFNAGWWAPSNDVPAIAELFTEAVARAGTLTTAFRPNSTAIARYERRALAAEYAELIHSLAAAPLQSALRLAEC
jgi:glycosyltransferase involved in cell wall biosynthesis